MSFLGIGGETAIFCPTFDPNAASGSAAVTNFGPTGAFTMENGTTGSHWTSDTGHGGNRGMIFASDRGVHLASHGLTKPFFFSMWIKPTTVGAFDDGCFLSQAATGNYWWIDNASGTYRLACYHGTTHTMTGANVNLNAWNHIVAGFNGSDNLRAWVNGTLAGTVTGTSITSLNTNALQIGRRSDSAGDCFRGSIGTARFFGEPLTTRDVAWLGRNDAIQGPVNWFPGRAA